GLYWLLRLVTGWKIAEHPDAVVRALLFVVNVVPFFLYLRVWWKLLERYARAEWARFFVLAAAGFGTLVTPFLITFNNHTVGTFCVLFALANILAIWNGNRSRWQFLSAGFFASFAACNE